MIVKGIEPQGPVPKNPIANDVNEGLTVATVETSKRMHLLRNMPIDGGIYVRCIFSQKNIY